MKLICFILFSLVSQFGICQSNKSDSIPKRHLLTIPNFSNLNSDSDCVICLIVKVDRNGKIVGTPTVDRSRTTTDNLVLINQLIEVVKREAIYTTSTLELEKMGLTIKIKKSSV